MKSEHSEPDHLNVVKMVRVKNVKYKIKKYRIILEPFKKNTAPAILSSALLKEVPYNQSMIFLPSDNLIGKINQFNKSISSNKKHLSENNIFIHLLRIGVNQLDSVFNKFPIKIPVLWPSFQYS